MEYREDAYLLPSSGEGEQQHVKVIPQPSYFILKI
jgi:hypothetical protein